MEELKCLSDKEALRDLIDYILGKDWYVVDPLGKDQINAIAVEEIKQKFDILTHKELKSKWNKLVDKLKFK